MDTLDFQAIQHELEDGASAGGGEVEPYLISLAISLKRIADSLETIASCVREGGDFSVSA